jgi:hypothetical protein
MSCNSFSSVYLPILYICSTLRACSKQHSLTAAAELQTGLSSGLANSSGWKLVQRTALAEVQTDCRPLQSNGAVEQFPRFGCVLAPTPTFGNMALHSYPGLSKDYVTYWAFISKGDTSQIFLSSPLLSFPLSHSSPFLSHTEIQCTEYVSPIP